nr:hypothetical protein [Amylibacter sp.]
MPEYSQYARSTYPQAATPATLVANTNSRKAVPDSAKNISRHHLVERAGTAVLDFCRPLSDFLNRGATGGETPLPVLDITILALDALLSVKDADGRQPIWRIVTGRVTRSESTDGLYHKGIWLESDDGFILDFNRPGLDGGFRVTRTDSGLIAEYRTDKPLRSPKTSCLLPVWRGEATGFDGFATQQQMRSAFQAMKQGVLNIMTTEIAHSHI